MSPYRSELLSRVALSEQAKDDLYRRMTAPERHYHTLDHLELLLERHLRFASDSIGSALQQPVMIAIAFHDAIFAAGANDNEARSADLWLEIGVSASTLNLQDRVWVADTIKATADHLGAARSLDLADAHDYARQWVLDLDLTPLGEKADVFDENMDRLCAENPSKPIEQGRADCLRFLRQFATVDPLYRCAPLAAEFTAPARANFLRHLAPAAASFP